MIAGVIYNCDKLMKQVVSNKANNYFLFFDKTKFTGKNTTKNLLLLHVKF